MRENMYYSIRKRITLDKWNILFNNCLTITS